MADEVERGVAMSQSLTKPKTSMLKRRRPRVTDTENKRKKVKEATESSVHPGVERSPDPGSEWLIQDYGEDVTVSLEFTTTYNDVDDHDDDVDDEQVELYLQAVQFLFATLKFAPLKKPSASLAADHTDCSHCNCTCTAGKGTKCQHCQFYPNSHAARCYAIHGRRSGNLAFILHSLPNYKPAGPRMIEAVRAAFKKRPLNFKHTNGRGGYVLGRYRLAESGSKAQSPESEGLLDPNLVATTSSGYEGYLMLLYDGGQLQGYGSTQEYTSLVKSRLLPVYREPDVLRRKVLLPPVVQEGKRDAVTRTFHYQTICWEGYQDACWKAFGRAYDVRLIPRALMQGPAPNPMIPGCSPVPLLDEHRYIQITLAQAFSNMPVEARGLRRRMVKDLKDPCPRQPPCTPAASSRLLSYFIIDRDGDGQPLRTVESGYIRFNPEDCKILVDFSCN